MISTSPVAPHPATTNTPAKPTSAASGVGSRLLPLLPKREDTTNSLLAEVESFKSQFEKSKNKADGIVPKTSSKLLSSLAPKDKDGKLKDKKPLPHALVANSVPLPVTPFVSDTRSWTLSFPSAASAKQENEPARTTNTTGAPDELKNLLKVGAPDSTKEHALQRTQIAFTVTVSPKEQTAGTKPSPITGKETQTGGKSNEVANPVAATQKQTPAVNPTGSPQSSSSAREHSASSNKGHSDTAKNGSNNDDEVTRSSSTLQTGQRNNAYASSSDSVHAQTSAPAAHVAEQPSSATAVAPAPIHNILHKVDPPNVAAATSAVDEDIKPVATPKPQSIDLKVGAADGSQVDVRVSQRAGDVQVTVRTADGDLAQSLRHHLPELSDRLTQTGTPGDFWQPNSAQSSSPSFSDGDSQDAPAQGNDSYGREQQNQRDHSQSDNQNEDGRQAAWFGELTDAQTRH